MARTSRLETYALMLGLLLLMGLASLLLLGPALGSGGGTITIAHQSDKTATIPDWLTGHQVEFPHNLIFGELSGHVFKHFEQSMGAYETYLMGLEHACVASRKFQGINRNGNQVEVYFCANARGQVAALFVEWVRVKGEMRPHGVSGYMRGDQWSKFLSTDWADRVLVQQIP